MDLEIKKNDTTIDLCKERDGLITIDISYQDNKQKVSVQYIK